MSIHWFQPGFGIAQGTLTWDELVDFEPRLEALRLEAADVEQDNPSYFCKLDTYNDRFKFRLSELVGPYCLHAKEIVRSNYALDVAREVILSNISMCDNCACIDADANFIFG